MSRPTALRATLDAGSTAAFGEKPQWGDMLGAHLSVFSQGFALNLALVATIGAQNVLIIRQGLLGEHLRIVVATCCVVDSVVITFGVVGFGTALAGDATLTATAAWAGTAFLLVYAAERLRSAVGPSRELDGIVPSPTLRRRALATALAVSMLNPQLYLDAFVLMGGVAAPLPHTERIAFAVGALLASSAWFAAFAFAATKLSARCFAGSLWRAVDVASCGCMLMFALAIVWHHDLLPTLLSVMAPTP